jgi:hypothetical protein
MLRSLKLAFCVTAFCLAALSGRAFSLLGPWDTWQVGALGYQLSGDNGGPMNLGEEYRVETPVLVYAYDSSFLQYFGSNGVAAVDGAIAIFNDLPPVSQFSPNLTEFPLTAKRVNYSAQALGIMDLKSTALEALTEQLGLASPVRYTWCLRGRAVYTVANVTYTNYSVLNRNFDPVNWAPSRYVNGVLYTYTIEDPILPGNYSDALETIADPLSFTYSSVADIAAFSGQFYTGLTRDDAGGLRYLYWPSNYNVQTLAAGVTNAGTGLGGPNGYTLWFGTNTVTGTGVTNLLGIVATNTTVATALRPGVDKVSFVKGYYDSLLGTAFVVVTNDYTDLIVTNFTLASQRLRRVITVPDIIFGAQDLGILTPSLAPVQLRRTAGFTSFAAINGTIPKAGPGVIRGPLQILFTTLYPTLLNDNQFLDEQGASTTVVWGSFNGSTNAPIIYPDYLSVRALEQMVLRRP